jgi:hypothetical protein
VNPVLTTDIEAGWRPLTAAETIVAASLIDDAWEILVARVPGIEDRLTAGDLRPGLVVKVVRDAVRAVMRNPEGYVRESIEDWSGQRDASSSGGRVTIPDEDIKLLMFKAPQRSAFAITPGWS